MVEIFTGLQPLEIGESDPTELIRRAHLLDASDAVDRVLVGYSSIWPHNHATAPFLAALTDKLSLIVAHRPGVIHPAAAARYFATLDVVSGGRLAINLVTGGSDKDLRREGDCLPKAQRYERAAEYIDVMTAAWQCEEQAVDHHGTYFTAERVHPLIRPVNGHVPIFMGGESDAAVDFGASHADTYMLWGEPLAGTTERIERVRTAAEGYGRTVEFSLSLRLFLGDTDDEAWAKARAVEQTIAEAQGSHKFLRSAATDHSVGRDRQLALTADELHDDCFWTGLTKLLGGFANSAALVGTEEQLLDTLAKYRQAGVSAFLITTGAEAAWDPELEDFCRRVKKEL